MRPRIRGWTPEVGQVSSPTRKGIPEYWEVVKRLCDHLQSTGQWEEQRRRQRLSWFWTELREGLVAQLRENGAIAAEIGDLENLVAGGQRTPASAAGQILAKTFLKP
jgi:LAO/AO transport system kinase